MRVVDVGGGTGGWAVPLAVDGCVVTVVDPSPDALANLRRRADEEGVAERVRPISGDTEDLPELVPDQGADLVLGHGVLEHVDELATALAALRAVTAPGGAVSVLVTNTYAVLLHHVLAGRLSEARALLDDPQGVPTSHGLERRFDTDTLHAALTDAGLRVESLLGYRTLADLVPARVTDDPSAAADLEALELTAAGTPPLRDIATRLHAIARREPE